jgi:glycosyltransferase involved in cell wall biosynthesis
MKILFLTQYYPPEIGAPQNRLHELALRLNQQPDIKVDVLTAMPNYPKMEIHEAYKGKRFIMEKIDDVQVYRSRIFVKKSKSIFFRLLNYFSFVWTSFWTGWKRLPKYDYILVESPPLFLGISGYLLCKLKKAKLIFNVSDLWPESAEKLGLVTNKLFLKSATVLEEFLYRKSALITGQTQGIVENISSRFPKKEVYWLPNGVDVDYYDNSKIESSWRIKQGFNETDLLILYAGIIGHAQGLETILQAAKLVENEQGVHFIFLGDGPIKDDLMNLKEKLNLKQVHFFDPVTKKDMPHIIKSCDLSVVPLRKLPLFEGAIPSKIFECLAMEKPVLLGVIGEAKALFIDEGQAGLAFEPENALDLSKRVNEIVNGKHNLAQLGSNGRKYVSEKFNRNQITQDFYQVLLNNNNKK